ncbi:MAG: sensor domain-containing diguanylate cyclase [Fibrobacteria bacterium]|nr:sensor domain-containing diguanylate cyclase [Fibrobacteria bacterium]
MMVKTIELLYIVREGAECFSRLKDDSKLHLAFIEKLHQILDEHSFAVYHFNASEQYIFPFPESYNTLESMGAKKYEKDIIEALSVEKPESLVIKEFTVVPYMAGRWCSGFILIRSKLKDDIRLTIAHLCQLWVQQKDKIELEHDNARLASELGRSLHNFSVVRSIAHTVSKAQDLKHLLSLILKVAITTVNASRGFIMLENENSRALELKVAQGLPNKEAERQINSGLLKAANIPLGEGIQGRVMETREPVLITKVFAEDGEVYGSEGGSFSLMCVPLMMHNNAFGVIYLTNNDGDEDFDNEDLNVLSILAAHASAVLDQSRLYALATTDELTGLYTRRYYSQRIGDEFKRCVRYKRHLSMIVADIDFFKKVNDKYGHAAGDHVLKNVAKILKKIVRSDVDTAVRFGGEEFVLLMPETHLQGAYIAAERLRKSVEEEIMVYDDNVIPITVSVGVSSYPENGSAIEELFSHSDRALYESKANGRNRSTSYPPL